jgi:hypothetical protein
MLDKSKFSWSHILNLVLYNLIYSSYLKFWSVEISVKSKKFWKPVLKLVLFNLIYPSYLKFWCVKILVFTK